MGSLAVEIWSTLRQFGSTVDTMAGITLPIRIEAIRQECDRTPLSDELFWRICVIDGEFMKLQNAKKEEQRKRKKGKHK